MNATSNILRGHDAIDYVEANGGQLNSYNSPVDDARSDISVDEAREIAAEDPSLVWCDTTAKADQ